MQGNGLFKPCSDSKECQIVHSEEKASAESLQCGRSGFTLCVVLALSADNCVFLLHAGVLYLQYGDETKQLRMPNEVTSTDTIRALFVSAFPQQLTMKMLESPSVAIYIKDDSRNVYYELNDVR
jgi:hypothetical protein